MKREDVQEIVGDLYDISGFEQISFWKEEVTDEFNSFLLKSRVIPFVYLKLLELLGGEEFYVGMENVTFSEHEGSQEEGNQRLIRQINVTNRLCTRKFDFEEVWDNIVGNLAIAQIITDKYVDIEKLEFRSNGDEKLNEVDLKVNWTAEYGDLLFIGKDFVMTQNEIFICSNRLEGIKEIIEKHHETWKDFIDEEHLAVTHERYMVWLQKEFPGKIKIRMLQ